MHVTWKSPENCKIRKIENKKNTVFSFKSPWIFLQQPLNFPEKFLNIWG